MYLSHSELLEVYSECGNGADVVAAQDRWLQEAQRQRHAHRESNDIFYSCTYVYLWCACCDSLDTATLLSVFGGLELRHIYIYVLYTVCLWLLFVVDYPPSESEEEEGEEEEEEEGEGEEEEEEEREEEREGEREERKKQWEVVGEREEKGDTEGDTEGGEREVSFVFTARHKHVPNGWTQTNVVPLYASFITYSSIIQYSSVS